MLAYDAFGFEIKEGSRVSWDLPSGETMTGVASHSYPEQDGNWKLSIKGSDGRVYALKVIEGECNEAGVI